MANVLADRVKETTTTTGTGTLTLAGAVVGFQSFAAIGNGNTTYYAISGGAEWEVGVGTYTASGTTLSRTTVFASSNAGALVSFSAGTKDVFCTYPAGRAVEFSPTDNTVSLLGTDVGILIEGITTEPSAPAAGTLEIYCKSIAGRMLPKWIGPSGFDTPFQAALSQNKVAWWNPPGNATTVPGVLGIAAPTSLGTATARNVAATNAFTRAKRLGYNSAATAGQAGGHYLGTAQYTTGAGGGLGGFYYVCRFGSADTLAQAIMFVGMSSSTATPTVTASPATFTNAIGVGCATGDTNLSIYYGGSAAQTPIALGASFPAKTASADLYELVLFASSATALSVGYRVTNVTSGVQASGTLTAASAGVQLPASTTFLAHRAYRSNNATATAVLIDIVSVYIETDT